MVCLDVMYVKCAIGDRRSRQPREFSFIVSELGKEAWLGHFLIA